MADCIRSGRRCGVPGWLPGTAVVLLLALMPLGPARATATCDVSPQSAGITLTPAADLQSLEGTVPLTLVSSGNYNLSIGSLSVSRPAGFNNYQASVLISRGTPLVVNQSEGASANSQVLLGPISFSDGLLRVRVEGRDGALLKAGNYRVQATITCSPL